jgi:replicative DNA helicase
VANAEQMLISSVVLTKDHVTASSKGITTKFFHSYADEWGFIERYIAKHRRAPSKTAFCSKFPKFRVQKTDDTAHWCEEVRNMHATAVLGDSVNNIIEYMEEGDVDKAIKVMHSSALAIESALVGESADSDIITNYQDVLDEVMKRHERQGEFGQAGIPTGFPTLDERTGGPQPGQVWIMAARLGQGKTWSLARMACAAAFSGYNIQYDALEGTRPEIAMRIHTFASSEYGKEVFKNLDLSMGQNFSPRAYKEFLHSLRNDVKGRMHIADTTKGPISPLSIAAQIERNKVDAVFLDYITLMDDGGEGDWKSIGALSKRLKQVAQMYQVPIIAAAQLNREAANLKDNAGPDKLAESDSIGRDADAVITARQMSKHVMAFKLAKYRHGRDGFIWYARFLPNTGHFEEITFDEAQDAVAEDKDSEVEDDYKFKPRQKGSFRAVSDAKHKTATVGGKKVRIATKSGDTYTVTDKRNNARSASKSASTTKRVVKRAK